MDVLIRHACSDDLPQILSLMKELAGTAGSQADLTPAAAEANWRRMEAFPNQYLTLVAGLEGEVVGAATLLFYASFLHRTGTAQINELVVRGDMRDRGIGAKLVAACRQEALQRGLDELEVGTETGNIKARAFYRKVGFNQEYVLLGMDFD